ncbi:TPA: tail fiber assembly protein [Morganella morganii]|nr:tail fiber assembly protein [Morganella morganii]
MTNYLYSAKNNAFFPTSFIDAYSDFNLSDAVEVEDSVYLEFINPPAGKIRIAGGDGLPAWGDIPPQTKEQLIEQADAKKQHLMADATVSMAPLQDADDIGEATDDELLQLKAWKKYRVLLNRVDTSTAPDITWPVKP